MYLKIFSVYSFEIIPIHFRLYISYIFKIAGLAVHRLSFCFLFFYNLICLLILSENFLVAVLFIFVFTNVCFIYNVLDLHNWSTSLHVCLFERLLAELGYSDWLQMLDYERCSYYYHMNELSLTSFKHFPKMFLFYF